MTFLQGLQRVLNCSKAQIAATGLASTWLAVRYAAADLPPTQRTALWVAFIGAVAVALREVINAWTEEDVASLSVVRGQNSSVVRGPDLSVGRGPLSVVEDEPARSPTTTNNPQPTTDNGPLTTNNPQRTPMPLRTKLPLLLIAFTTITLLAGCQTCPELAVYREGLHQIDEPLYQAHLMLLDDAVKSGLRADADRQVIQQGIAAARGLYQQSAAAATQPAQ